MTNSAHTSLTCVTHGWDSATEQDVELPSIFVTIWVRGEGNASHALELECKTPDELWHFIREMNNNRAGTLAQTFNYKEPAGRAPALPMNLGDLFQ